MERTVAAQSQGKPTSDWKSVRMDKTAISRWMPCGFLSRWPLPFTMRTVMFWSKSVERESRGGEWSRRGREKSKDGV